MTMVSVIIPVYNGASFIRRAVDTALCQVDVETEVIVVDDGSTDETWAILESYGGAIHRLRQTNSGQVRARNRGAQLARSQWLAFLDADDEWLPNKLAMQLAVADDGSQLIYTDRVNIGDADHVLERLSEGCNLLEGDVFEALLLGNFITLSSVLISRAWFDRLDGFEESLPLGLCEDWDLWLRLVATGGRVGVCREGLTRYRWSKTSLSHKSDLFLSGHLRVLERALSQPRAKGLDSSFIRRAYASAYAISAWYAAPTRRLRAAALYAGSALYCPGNLDVYKGMVKCVLGIS